MKKRMRKTGTLLLCFVLCILLLSGCSKDQKAEPPKEPTETTETVKSDSGVVKKSEAKKWSKEYDLKNVVFTDNENYSYTLSEIGIDPAGNARLDISYENKTDQEITFYFGEFYLNRYFFNFVLGDETVAPGETKKSKIEVSAEDLANCNITDLEEIKLRFDIKGAALGNERIQEPHTLYPTGLTADTYQPEPHQNAEGSFEILNNDTITFSIQEINKSELHNETRLWIYTECKVAEQTFLTVENFKVNGTDVYYRNNQYYMAGNSRRLDFVIINDTGVSSMDDIHKIEFDIHTERSGSPYHDHIVYEK